MNIHQLSVTYQPEQDRILVRVNTTAAEEMRMWLTRRLMAGLWPLLGKLQTEQLLRLEAAGSGLDQADEGLRKMVADFRKAEFLQQADFATPYRNEQPQLPLGGQPLLVTDAQVTELPEGRVRLGFREHALAGTPGRSFQMELEPRLLQGLVHLVEQALAQSGWRDSFAAAPAVDDSNPAVPAGQVPRYLN